MNNKTHKVISTVNGKETIVAECDTIHEAFNRHREHLEHLWEDLGCSVNDEGQIVHKDGSIETVTII